MINAAKLELSMMHLWIRINTYKLIR